MRFQTVLIISLIIVGSATYLTFSQKPNQANYANQTISQESTLIENSSSENNSANNHSNTYTLNEVANHSTQDDCWSAINNDIYNLTSYISFHPGGVRDILKICGKDGSSAFNREHGNSRKAQASLIPLKIGSLSSDE